MTVCKAVARLESQPGELLWHVRDIPVRAVPTPCQRNKLLDKFKSEEKLWLQFGVVLEVTSP